MNSVNMANGSLPQPHAAAGQFLTSNQQGSLMNWQSKATSSGNAKMNGGFSLLELMVTVAVVAILAAIAIPAYTDYIHRTNRSEGQALLSDAAAREERYFSDYNQYSVALTNLQYSADPFISEHQYYKLKATSTDTSSNYTLTVTAQGSQCSDTTSSSKCDQKCYTMTQTNTGAKGSADVGGTANATEPGTCWK